MIASFNLLYFDRNASSLSLNTHVHSFWSTAYLFWSYFRWTTTFIRFLTAKGWINTPCMLYNHTKITHTHTHKHTYLTALSPGLPRWASTKMDLSKARDSEWQRHQLGWAICKSATRSRQITTPEPHHSVSYWSDALPVTQPTASKHWMQE